LKSTLNVSKAATMSSTLTVSDASTLKSTLNVSKAATMSSTLTVSAASTLKSTLSVSKAATMSSTLAVTGASTLSSTLYVGNTITISGDIIPSEALTFNIGSRQKPFKDMYLSSGTIHTINESGSSSNAMSIDNGTVTVTETTADNVENVYTLVGSINNKVGLGEISSIDALSTLDISGDLHVTEDVSFNSSMAVGSTLEVSGASTLKSTLSVSKAATMSSTLAVTGASTLKSTLSVSKAATMSSTLVVTGKTTLSDDVSMNANVDISGNLVINGNLSVFQTKSTETIKTTVNDYTLIVTEDLSLNGKMFVSGDVSFNSNGVVDVCGNFYAQYPNNSIPSSAINGGILTIQHTSDTGDTELVSDVLNVKTLQFDKDSGFDVSFQSAGIAKIRMNSTFKYWEINGNEGLTAEGLDTVNLIAGNDIILSADNTPDAKSVTITYDKTKVDISLNTKVDLTSQQSIGGHKTFTSDISFSKDVDITGKLSHKGLAITDGTEIDQMKEFTKTLTPTIDTWYDTGISGTDLASGIYIISFNVDDTAYGGTHNNETYTGTLSWYSGSTNSSNSDEILLHRSGDNPGSGTIYLRTLRNVNGTLKLQIYSNNSVTNYPYVFKFRRFM